MQCSEVQGTQTHRPKEEQDTPPWISHFMAQHNEGENKKGCRLVQTQDISNPVQWYVSENLLGIGEQK